MGYRRFQIRRIRIFLLRLVTKPRLARRAFGSDHPHKVGRFLILARGESEKLCRPPIDGGRDGSPSDARPPLVWAREGEAIAEPSPAGSYGHSRARRHPRLKLRERKGEPVATSNEFDRLAVEARCRLARFILRSQGTSSPTSCGSSPNCDRRQSRQQHEAFGVTRSSKPTGEMRLDCGPLACRTFDAASARLDAVRRRAGGSPAASSGLSGTLNGRRFGLSPPPSGGCRLQYIRLNGTFIGGLAGPGLYAGEHALGLH